MLAANEAAAQRLDDHKINFLRRVHPAPEPNKLKAFAEFARILGYKIKQESDRFALQHVLDQSAGKPEAHAVHYAMLRSLKQATYSPQKDDHYALASENYCHLHRRFAAIPISSSIACSTNFSSAAKPAAASTN